MRLTRYTDFSLRVLIRLATEPEGFASIAEIAAAYGVSEDHLKKVVQNLAALGHVETVRGRNGGLRLARRPADINVGALIRQTEDNFDLVECSSCVIAPACELTIALDKALAAFMAVLDNYTLADLVVRRKKLAALLGLNSTG